MKRANSKSSRMRGGNRGKARRTNLSIVRIAGYERFEVDSEAVRAFHISFKASELFFDAKTSEQKVLLQFINDKLSDATKILIYQHDSTVLALKYAKIYMYHVTDKMKDIISSESRLQWALDPSVCHICKIMEEEKVDTLTVSDVYNPGVDVIFGSDHDAVSDHYSTSPNDHGHTRVFHKDEYLMGRKLRGDIAYDIGKVFGAIGIVTWKLAKNQQCPVDPMCRVPTNKRIAEIASYLANRKFYYILLALYHTYSHLRMRMIPRYEVKPGMRKRWSKFSGDLYKDKDNVIDAWHFLPMHFLINEMSLPELILREVTSRDKELVQKSYDYAIDGVKRETFVRLRAMNGIEVQRFRIIHSLKDTEVRQILDADFRNIKIQKSGTIETSTEPMNYIDVDTDDAESIFRMQSEFHENIGTIETNYRGFSLCFPICRMLGFVVKPGPRYFIFYLRDGKNIELRLPLDRNDEYIRQWLFKQLTQFRAKIGAPEAWRERFEKRKKNENKAKLFKHKHGIVEKSESKPNEAEVVTHNAVEETIIIKEPALEIEEPKEEQITEATTEIAEDWEVALKDDGEERRTEILTIERNRVSEKKKKRKKKKRKKKATSVLTTTTPGKLNIDLSVL